MFKEFVLMSLILFAIGCSTPQSIRIKRLALIDDNGIERVVLTTGSGEIQADGKSGQRRSPATGLILYNSKGNETGGIAVLDDGTTALVLDGYSQDGTHERASIYVLPDGKSGILLNDAKGNVRAKLGVDEKMNTVFELAGEDGKAKVSATVTPDGKVTLVQPKSK